MYQLRMQELLDAGDAGDPVMCQMPCQMPKKRLLLRTDFALVGVGVWISNRVADNPQFFRGTGETFRHLRSTVAIQYEYPMYLQQDCDK